MAALDGDAALLRAPALDQLAELGADDLERAEQLLVGLELAVGEALDHPDDAALAADREADRGVQPGRPCDLAAGQAGVARRIGDPDSLARLPHRAREALAGAEGGRAGHSGEFVGVAPA